MKATSDVPTGDIVMLLSVMVFNQVIDHEIESKIAITHNFLVELINNN